MPRLRHNHGVPSLQALYIYPLKSCAPLARDSAQVEARGLGHDRRWMAVDQHGKFLTARKHPRLTLIRAQPDGDWLTLQAPGMPQLHVVPAHDEPRQHVTVWNSQVQAVPADSAASDWISRFLGIPSRLVFMDAVCRRPVNPQYSREDDLVSFADGYPLLLISHAALDQLNQKLNTPVPIERFRPNIVVDGVDAHAEDDWRRIRIGGIEFDIVKPCTRCVLTTVDYTRGEFDAHGEPLRTLMTYRRGDDGVTFGQNLIARGEGVIGIGDAVEVVA